jgi:hypothetical protein
VRSPRPPRVATFLLRRFRRADDPLVGDLLEAFQARGTVRWYWKQVLYVIASSAWRELQEQSAILVIATLFSIAIALMTYVAFQQAYRTAANYPQIDIAEDAASALGRGALAADVIPPYAIDLRRNVSPYVIVFDDRGRPVRGSVILNGRIPSPPPGVFEFARRNAVDHRFTWQPMRGVRSAVVLRHFGGPNGDGFVLVGRSLHETESAIARMTQLVLLAWTGSLILLFVWFTLRNRKGRAI